MYGNKIIELKHNFGFVFNDEGSNKKHPVALGLSYKDKIVIDNGWQDIDDFAVILLMVSLKSFGKNTQVSVGDLICYGIKKEQFELHIKIRNENLEPEIVLNTLECRQLHSKLNRLLHATNKYQTSQHFS